MPSLSAEQKLERRIKSRFQKAIYDYGLVDDGDKILVGLSGGKDSLCLLDLLAERQKITKPDFSVEALHIRMSNIKYESDISYLQDFTESRGVRFHLVTTGFDASTDSRKSPCFLCSWNRRKALFEIAREEGCNKIALGHHMDDILETLLMNITFQGAFGTMPPKLTMKKFQMTIIRPLCLVHESDLQEWAHIHSYKLQSKKCPYEHQSNRTAMKQILAQLTSMNPEARYSLWGSMSNIQDELLPKKRQL